MKKNDLAFQKLLEIREKDFIRSYNKSRVAGSLSPLDEKEQKDYGFAYRMGYKSATRSGKELNQFDQELYDQLKEGVED